MIPILYDKHETQFLTNGICRLVDCITCEVTEERNGIYEVEFTYPIDGKWFDEIEIGRIICVSHDESMTVQPFDIYKRSAEIDGIVTFNASHVSYRLGSVILNPFEASTCLEAMELIPQNTTEGIPFTFWTDKNVTANFKLPYPQNVRATLSGTEGSLLDVYGTGEYEFDKWAVKLYGSRGADTNATLRYGKNISGLTAEQDDSGVYNAAIGYWYSAETGESVIMPNPIVADGTLSEVAPWTDQRGRIVTDENETDIEFDTLKLRTYALDLTQDFPEKPTLAQLESLARKRFASAAPWEVSETITIDFVQLWQTEEYANVAPIERVKLCDTVIVMYPEAKVNVRKKVIKVVYDVLLDRYSSMQLGTPHATLSSSIKAVTQQATMKSAASMMQQAIGEATQMITGGLGGYVVINMIGDRPAEILVLDTPDIASAINVIRINNNGIGFSQSGYGGPYRTAWTIDGRFNADFITTGHLSANKIEGGILKALEGNSQWNLNTGVFRNDNGTSRVYMGGGASLYHYNIDGVWTQIGRLNAGYYSDQFLGNYWGLNLVAAYNRFVAISAVDSSGTVIPRIIVNAGGYPYYDENVIVRGTIRFTHPIRLGKVLIRFGTESEYTYSPLLMSTRQLVIAEDNTTSMMASDTYGLRVVKAIYTDDKISCTTVTQRSDERLKNFMDWDERYDGLIDVMEPQLYTWKEGTDKSVHVGLSAQKLKKAIEDAGITDSGMVTEEEYLSIAYTEIPLLMMRKIKKQQETIETLEARIEALERKVETLCKYMNSQHQE